MTNIAFLIEQHQWKGRVAYRTDGILDVGEEAARLKGGRTVGKEGWFNIYTARRRRGRDRRGRERLEGRLREKRGQRQEKERKIKEEERGVILERIYSEVLNVRDLIHSHILPFFVSCVEERKEITKKT